MYRKTPPVRISYVNEGMLCKIKTKGHRQDGNKSGSGWVLWQISWWMGANCAIHQKKKISGMFQIEIQLKIAKLWIYLSFSFAVLETDEMPNNFNETIKAALRSLIVLVEKKMAISGLSSTMRNSHLKCAFICFMFWDTVHSNGIFFM